MKKPKLRCRMDLPKVSKITRPRAVTQIRVFKLRTPDMRPPAYHPLQWLAPPCWVTEALQPSQGPSEGTDLSQGNQTLVFQQLSTTFDKNL